MPIKEKNIKKTFRILKIIFIFLIFFSFALTANCKTEKVDWPKISNPLGSTKTPQVVIGNVITVLLGVVGSLALIMFIYGGFTWILSGGNEENVKKGKETLKWSIVGIIIIFASYAILNFVLSALEGTEQTITPSTTGEQVVPPPTDPTTEDPPA